MNWHIKNWINTWKNFTKKLCIYEILSSLYFFKPFKTKLFKYFVKEKHEYILSILNRTLNPILKKYTDNSNQLATLETDKTIWVFWWQGLNEAPDLVKTCIKSMQKNANGADVIILSKYNYKNYIDIPDYIEEKYNEGIMCIAMYSDYLRTCLIEKYGGLWLDATIFVTKNIPAEYFLKNYYTLHTKDLDSPCISNNKIHWYVFGGKKGYSMFSYLKEAQETYWREYSFAIDYYLIDYIIMYGYYNAEWIKNVIDSLDYTGETVYAFREMLNKQYNDLYTRKIINDNVFEKLNWRIKCKEHTNNKLTTYGYLKDTVK